MAKRIVKFRFDTNFLRYHNLQLPGHPTQPASQKALRNYANGDKAKNNDIVLFADDTPDNSCIRKKIGACKEISWQKGQKRGTSCK